MTSSRRFTFSASVLALTLAFLSLSACAPKDEKVSDGNGFSGNGQTDSRMDDRVTEYSRSMLIELADVARQAEGVLQLPVMDAPAAVEKPAAPVAVPAPGPVAAAPIAPAPVPATPAAAPPAASAVTVAATDASVVTLIDSASTAKAPASVPVQSMKAPSCKVGTLILSPVNTLMFDVESKGCKEKGATFEGTQYGHEVSFGAISKTEGQPTLVTMLKVEGKGIETTLKPNVNPKDTLRVKNYRFLEAHFVSETAGERLYRFTYENYGTYSLDLKALTDNGAITSTLSGILVYNLASGKVTAFRAPEAADRMNLRVESARLGRNGGKVIRQEFYGSGVVRELAVNLASCALPTGIVTSRFTVRPLVSGDKKYTLDSATVINSFEDHVINTQKSDVSKAKIAAKLCSSEDAITMTEFYAGLLY